MSSAALLFLLLLPALPVLRTQHSPLLVLVRLLLGQYLLGQKLEDPPHVRVLFAGGLDEGDVVPLGQTFPLLPGDFPVLFEVCLGGDEDHVGVGVAGLPDLVYPAFDVGEGVEVGDGVGEDDAVGALVEGLGDVPEALLSGGVPDVEGDLGTVEVDALDFEVDADGAEVVGLEVVLAVPDQQTGLPDPAVSHHQVLECIALTVHSPGVDSVYDSIINHHLFKSHHCHQNTIIVPRLSMPETRSRIYQQCHKKKLMRKPLFLFN